MKDFTGEYDIDSACDFCWDVPYLDPCPVCGLVDDTLPIRSVNTKPEDVAQ